MENRQSTLDVSYNSCNLYDGMGAGEYIPIPEEVQGVIEVEIGTGIYHREPVGFVGGMNIGQYPVFNDFENRVRWLLYQTPTLDVVNGYGKDIETKDIEYSSWINAYAKEELKIDTIVGNVSEKNITGLGVLLRKEDNHPIVKFTRAGITDYIEKLLIGTVYSQYSHRMNTLSGTIRLLDKFATYTDNNESGCYFPVSDIQHLIMDESEVKLLQVELDNYEGINYEKTI